MARSSEYSPEVLERAVRMVRDQMGEHASQWTTIEAIAPKLGCKRRPDADGCGKPGAMEDGVQITDEASACRVASVRSGVPSE